jgi:hypothetical protein
MELHAEKGQLMASGNNSVKWLIDNGEWEIEQTDDNSS